MSPRRVGRTVAGARSPPSASISRARSAAPRDWNGQFRRRMMTIEPRAQERDLLQEALDSCPCERRPQIAAAERDTSTLPAEEDLMQALQKKLAA
jgi:hypothetical protein